jgi:hypothetical protein
MSAKLCPKHNKPYPCGKCRIENAQKPAQAPPISQDSQEVRSTSEIVDEVFDRVNRTYSKRDAKTALRIALTENGPLPRKRGRKPKYATEEERKVADAARKRDERKQNSEAELVAKLADRTGTDFRTGPQDALLVSKSGGYNSNKIDKIVAEQDISRLSSPNADVSDELTTPDRKVTAVPKNPDNDTKDTRETDNTFMRRADVQLRRWIKGPVKKPCVSEHAGIAEHHKDSKRKLYCGKCRKLLVNPGKPVNGVSIRDTSGNFVPIFSGNFPDAQAGDKKASANMPHSIDTKEDVPRAA